MPMPAQTVSSFELLLEYITPVSSSGSSTTVTTTTAAALQSRLRRSFALPVVKAAAASSPFEFTVPNAIQGYFLLISNLNPIDSSGANDVTLTLTFPADETAAARLVATTNPSNPTSYQVLAITNVGSPLDSNGNVVPYFNGLSRNAQGQPSLTLPVAIKAGASALFALVGNYALPDNPPLEARGRVDVSIASTSPSLTAQLALSPQIRTVFLSPNSTSTDLPIGDITYSLPTVNGPTLYSFPYFYIQSKLNGYVLDSNGQTLSNGNVQVVMNPQNGNASQLWTLTGDGFIINAASRQVLDVQGGSTTSGTPVITFTKKSPAANNQLWNFTSSGYIQTLLGNNLVLDITGGSTSAGAPVQSYTQGSSPSNNQLWSFVPATE